ncbi:DUF1120 domain-containing protein [Pseudomonas fluorescens]|jgi:hypothetical protein|uniref:DUF1120 domain-containing protein n=1 Tax=Pseudomonas fluorescens TaxID=294 RepID=UPI00285C902A|nr:DUF1120 domain-containing protein [Pseudomonas fluorescens]MDR6165560.1 hypothetical protein [Pseudomonas fluorescens]
MMLINSKALLAALTLASASSAFAAATADLRITGTITPAACTPVFAKGGVVDYGNIAAETLSSTSITKLSKEYLTYTITCDAPVAIGTSWVDNRADAGGNGSDSFGLGKQGSKDIGFYQIRHVIGIANADGADADNVYSEAGSAWKRYNNEWVRSDNGQIVSFAPTGTLTPFAYTTYSGVLEIQASIFEANSLDMTSAIDFDGLATMEVVYP